MKNVFTKEKMREQHRHSITRMLCELRGDNYALIEALTDYVMKRISLVIASERAQQTKRESGNNTRQEQKHVSYAHTHTPKPL